MGVPIQLRFPTGYAMSRFTAPPSSHQTLFRWVLIFFIAAIVVGEPLLIWPAFKKLSGRGINWRAWRASYSERQLSVPSDGQPREGIWGVKLSPVWDKKLGLWILPERHVPSVFDIDGDGFQYASTGPHPTFRILIMGGSVAAGAYASSEARTYFHQLANRLRARHHSVQITVEATGAWTSREELQAFKEKGVSLKPDIVVLLDGLNDITLNNELPLEQRVGDYLGRMKQLRDLALAQGAKVVFAPQPFLPQKRHKTALEMIIQMESVRPVDRLVQSYGKLLRGLRDMSVPHQVYYMDCSGAFDRTRFTTFTDIWHFADVGHARLAEYMTVKLDPILRDIENQKGVLPRELASGPPPDSPYFHF